MITLSGVGVKEQLFSNTAGGNSAVYKKFLYTV